MEWLFLLLPIAAMSGWLSARKHYKKPSNPKQSYFDPEYFKGLNYLLNEEPDKAIDVFIRLLEVNSETVETHLALANLFRRRGETERAIRIHQNLIARPTLTLLQREQALIELGLDYMSAGVLDRAELLFLELLNSTAPPSDAYEHLLNIYQQERQWQKAINIAKKLHSQDPQKKKTEIAQFYCELAEEALDNMSQKALVLLKKASKFDSNCVRASLLRADLHIKDGHYNKALKSLNRIEQQDPHYIPEALPLLKTCYQKLDKLPAFDIWLKLVLVRHPIMTSVHLMLTQVIEIQYGLEEAQNYLQQQLKSKPSIEGLDTLLSLGDIKNPTLIPLVQDTTRDILQKKRTYLCHQCGFAGKTMHWHCPSCQQWSTIRPTELHSSALEHILDT
jgi:lipopolysaccharide biosynthesis regulator YciM